MAITKIRGSQIHDLTLTAAHLLLNGSSEFDASAIKLKLADGVATYEPATVGQLDTANLALDAKIDAMAIGLSPKASVIAIKSDNLEGSFDATEKIFTVTANGALVIDGVTLEAGERVALIGQTAAEDRGIFVVTQVGDESNPAILTRAADFDNSPTYGEIRKGAYFYATEGTLANKGYYVVLLGTELAPVSADDFVLGETEIHFDVFNNIVNPSIAPGDGIEVATANGTTTITANIDGVTIVADENGVLSVDTSASVSSANDGDGITITDGVISADLEADNGLVLTNDEAAGAQKIAIKATTFFLNNFKVKHGACAGGTAEALEVTDAALSSYDELCHKVYLNGQLLRLTTDYTIATSNTTNATVTFAATVVTVANDDVRVEGFVNSPNVA